MEFDTNDIAELCFVHPQTIRVWEKQGLIPKAERRGMRRWWTKEQADEIVRFSDARYNTERK